MTVSGIRGYKFLQDLQEREYVPAKTMEFATTCLKVGGGFEEDILDSLHSCTIGSHNLIVSPDKLKRADYAESSKRIRLPLKKPFTAPPRGRVELGGKQIFHKSFNINFSAPPTSFISISKDEGLQWTAL